MFELEGECVALSSLNKGRHTVRLAKVSWALYTYVTTDSPRPAPARLAAKTVGPPPRNDTDCARCDRAPDDVLTLLSSS